MRIIARTDTKAVHFLYHTVWRQSKTLILSTNIDKKIDRNRVFYLHLLPDSCNFYPRSLIVKSVFDCHLPVSLSTLHQFCALLHVDVVSFSNYERTTLAKRTITATAGIQNEKSGFWVHK